MHWLSWKKLCVPKEEGGLGFKDFKAFNQALLARQAWRILQNPDTLYARTMKGRYFPKTSFLQAVHGSNPSWGWRSVLYGRELLTKGIRWQIGSGNSINPFLDPWVPNTRLFLPILNFSDPFSIIPGSVSDLICRGRWNTTLLNSIFDDFTSQQILSIPLPLEAIDDKIIWQYAPSGAYTVHSGYELARGKFSTDLIYQPTSLYDKHFWNLVWSLPVQPKLKIFLWKIFKGILPTRGNLAKRFTLVTDCPVCLEEEESSEHLFMRCILAKKLAQLLNIQIHVFYHDSVAYSWRILFKMNQQYQVKILIFWWRLWKSRNNVVFTKSQQFLETLYWQFKSQLQEQEDFMRRARQPNPRPQSTNHIQNGNRTSSFPPSFSVQVDGAVSHKVGGAIGFIVRDSFGKIIYAGGKSFKAISDSFTIESLAVRDALVWCLDMRVSDILIEGDAQSVQKKVLDSKTLHPHAGAIIQEIRILITKFRRFEYLTIPRDRNHMAHNLAKFSLSFLPNSSGMVNLTLFASINDFNFLSANRLPPHS
ncbi:Uncharacterized mitochondrial protein AtMg00310 [Linum perenne]